MRGARFGHGASYLESSSSTFLSRTPPGPIVGLLLRKALLFLDERAVSLWNPRIRQDGQQNAQRRFRIRRRTVSLFESNTQAGTDFAKRTAALVSLQFPHPSERVDPFNLAPKRPTAGTDDAGRARELCLQEASIERGIVCKREASGQRRFELRRDF